MEKPAPISLLENASMDELMDWFDNAEPECQAAVSLRLEMILKSYAVAEREQRMLVQFINNTGMKSYRQPRGKDEAENPNEKSDPGNV